MSRLTERFGQNATTKEPCYIPSGIGDQEGNSINAIVEKLGRLEDLEDEGRLIVLPCKAGDDVWLLYNQGKEIGRETIRNIYIGERFDRLEFFSGYVHTIWDKKWDDHFGKTVFTSASEAKAKLAEYQGCGNCSQQPAPLETCEWLKHQKEVRKLCPEFKLKEGGGCDD